MACRLDVVKPLSVPRLEYCNRNSNIFIEEIRFNKSSISSRPQCVILIAVVLTDDTKLKPLTHSHWRIANNATSNRRAHFVWKWYRYQPHVLQRKQRIYSFKQSCSVQFPGTHIVRLANMGPTWVLMSPGGSHVGPMNLAIRVCSLGSWNLSGRRNAIYCTQCNNDKCKGLVILWNSGRHSMYYTHAPATGVFWYFIAEISAGS